MAIKIGSSHISKIYVGNSSCSRVYTGSTLIWPILSNLIVNGNMEYCGYWSFSNVSEDASNKFVFAPNSTAMAQQTDASVVPLIAAGPIANHIYYGRCLQKAPSGSTFADGRFEWFIGDGENQKITFCSMSATNNEWVLASGRGSLSNPVSSNWCIRSFTVNGTATAYRKEMMIVDLTASYGAGSEPTKEWCDINIGYISNAVEPPYLESVVRYTTSGTVSVPTGMRYMDIFLVNGGNCGNYKASKDATYAGGAGGVTTTQYNIPVSGSVFLTIGAGSTSTGGKGGVTSLVYNGTSYSSSQSSNPANTGYYEVPPEGTDGATNPFGNIEGVIDSNLYGASGGYGNWKIANTPDVKKGGTTGGGDGAIIYGSNAWNIQTINGTNGTFYGAGGGGGQYFKDYITGTYSTNPGNGYQGCVIIRWKNKIQ